MTTSRRRRALRRLAWALGLGLALWLVALVTANLFVAPPATPALQGAPARAHAFDKNAPDGRNTNRIFVALTLSGGGTRAAAFGYGVLAKLREYELDDTGRTLLDELDLVSSVSGGSFTAAYYGLFGDEIFERFEDEVLRRDLQGALAREMFSPRNLWRLQSPALDRIDLAAELYQREIFRDRTFADLAGRRPHVVINATNVTFGSQFSFEQSSFDFLGADLSAFPIGRAVAASSAFPLLLSPVTLTNHPRDDWDMPQWVTSGLHVKNRSARKRAVARTLAPYHIEKDEHRYMHLVDGGLSDNTGLRYVMHVFKRGYLGELVQSGQVEQLLIIVVNALTKPAEDLDRRSAGPGAGTVAYKTAVTSMDNFTFETVEAMRETLARHVQSKRSLEKFQSTLESLRGRLTDAELEAFLAEEGVQAIVDAEQTPLVAELAELSLEQIADREVRARMQEVSTSFDLSDDDIEALIEAGGAVLDANKDFNDFLEALER